MIKKPFLIFTGALLLLLTCTSPLLFSQDSDIPEKPNPPRLVNDYAGFLTADENFQLERKLVAYSDSTSVQIAVVVVKSLNGYDIGDLATRIGKKWGIGEAGKNNGILILIKPRYERENGKAWIATGYGTESSVPDVICKRIVDYDILPAFKAGQNFAGLDKATGTIYSLLRNEYTPNQYLAKHPQKKKKSKFPVAIIIIVIIVIMISSRKNSSNSRHISTGSSLPFWMLLGMMNSGDHRGSFGDFSSGGGGFGGFGGGDFGGGGAGGDW